jgi:hypothetical protein
MLQDTLPQATARRSSVNQQEGVIHKLNAGVTPRPPEQQNFRLSADARRSGGYSQPYWTSVTLTDTCSTLHGSLGSSW